MKERTQSAAPVILVADDEAPIRQMARRILERGGYTVMEAGNGAEAVTLMSDNRPLDLLMADLEMPELMGDEMAKQLRAMRPDLKVLFVTGQVNRLFEKQPVLWDGQAFLEKPFTANSLLQAVSLLLFGTTKRGTEFPV